MKNNQIQPKETKEEFNNSDQLKFIETHLEPLSLKHYPSYIQPNMRFVLIIDFKKIELYINSYVDKNQTFAEVITKIIFFLSFGELDYQIFHRSKEVNKDTVINDIISDPDLKIRILIFYLFDINLEKEAITINLNNFSYLNHTDLNLYLGNNVLEKSERDTNVSPRSCFSKFVSIFENIFFQKKDRKKYKEL